ncbi:MAG TPA: type II toxin-antitoxin system RelE/ParE family toxin [Armatimonadota bacterium]|nr:type II toxin-antitoxin system RelE/ParE family toxin [Armatimonadota bacterium]HOS42319.1 type II toxin-antitoxin system RelE/ParE family toxin [Armatimonadota bacterium]
MIDAARYYEQQVAGLGTVFLDKLEAAIFDIAKHPYRWPILRAGIRRRLIHRFPYGLYYRIEKNTVVIVAVAHLHRRPMYWINRV